MLVSWMTTNKCNLKCVHCYQDAEEATDKELSCEEGKKMIDEIARAGFKVMIFSGGEPLMRPDIYELVAHAASRGLRPVFGSNGTLITPEVAVRLKEAGACAMGISVDSLDAVKHDRFRGLEHAYDLTMAGIEACKQAGLPFQLHTTVVDWNRDEVCDITNFAVEIGAMAHYVFFLIPVGRGKFIQETSLEVLENEQLLKDFSLESIIEMNPDYIFVVPMGNDDAAAMKALEDQTAANPAWSTLDAVQNGRYVTLDPHLFQYKPNERWDQSYQVLFDALYA